MRCFEAECEGIVQTQVLRDGCRDACRGGAQLTQLICDAATCSEVVDSVTELAGQNFCSDNAACEDAPRNVLYVEFGEACNDIDYDCPPDADFYRDECGCGCIFQDIDCSNPPEGVRYVAEGEECNDI
jgi:hypothetical protein